MGASANGRERGEASVNPGQDIAGADTLCVRASDGEGVGETAPATEDHA